MTKANHANYIIKLENLQYYKMAPSTVNLPVAKCNAFVDLKYPYQWNLSVNLLKSALIVYAELNKVWCLYYGLYIKKNGNFSELWKK